MSQQKGERPGGEYVAPQLVGFPVPTRPSPSTHTSAGARTAAHPAPWAVLQYDPVSSSRGPRPTPTSQAHPSCRGGLSGLRWRPGLPATADFQEGRHFLSGPITAQRGGPCREPVTFVCQSGGHLRPSLAFGSGATHCPGRGPLAAPDTSCFVHRLFPEKPGITWM